VRRAQVIAAAQLLLVMSSGPIAAALAQEPASVAPVAPAVGLASATVGSYVLGPGDVLAIKALDAEDVTSGAIRVDPSGDISLPLVGRLSAAGLTVEQLEKDLSARLRTYVRNPVVAVSVVEYRGQPVSVIGSVGQPGVVQLEGRKTLIEVLAKAGGLRPDAANTIKITRRAESGAIPLASAVKDPSGQFTVAEVSLSGIMQATHPEENILILPNDVITVPRAALVYVVGEVKKQGGFILQERASISGLQALALAEGFTIGAAPQNALIIRQSAEKGRVEIPTDLKEILKGKKTDVQLLPEDILFVPGSAAKSALARVAQTAIQAATSATIYRGFY
jgi:polysaccharide biosynthesis/export protein